MNAPPYTYDVNAEDPRWKQAGMTYRKLDHWTTRGYLRTVYESNPGSGSVRLWPASEIRVAARMVAITKLGFTVAAAERLARDHAECERVAEALMSS